MYKSTLADLKIIGIGSNGIEICADVEHDPPEGAKIEGTFRVPLAFDAETGLIGVNPAKLPDALADLAVV